jgi:hypothetical protein
VARCVRGITRTKTEFFGLAWLNWLRFSDTSLSRKAREKFLYVRVSTCKIGRNGVGKIGRLSGKGDFFKCIRYFLIDQI